MCMCEREVVRCICSVFVVCVCDVMLSMFCDGCDLWYVYGVVCGVCFMRCVCMMCVCGM